MIIYIKEAFACLLQLAMGGTAQSGRDVVVGIGEEATF